VGDLLVSLVGDEISQSDQVISLERWLQTGQVIQGAPNGPDVDFVVVGLCLHNLRSQVQRRTYTRPLDE